LSVKKERVAIHLQTMIDDGAEKEYHSIEEMGTFLRRGEIDVLTFYERTKEEGEVRHLISIYPDKVNINRTGEVRINQQFLLRQKTESKLQLPQGNIHMEIVTKKIDYQPMERHKKGILIINYEATLNGQMKRNHTLELTYNKEEMK